MSKFNQNSFGTGLMHSLARTTSFAAITLSAVLAGPVGIDGAAARDVNVTRTDAKEQIKLGLNKSVIITLPSDAYDILVANPSVADAVTRTSRRIYLFGKSVGETNIFVFGQNGEQIASFDLQIERDVAGLEQYLKRFLPSSEIDVELINDNVVLTGTVETPLDAKRAAELANLFVSGGEATTGQYSQSVSAPTDGGGVTISDPDEARRESKIVNLIKIVGEDQVTLKVTVAEVSRNVMKQLNFRMSSGNSGGISWGLASMPPSGITTPIAQAGALGFGKSNFSTALEAMEQTGVMKTLAEPTLTAVSGEQATFRVGGTFQQMTEYTSPARNLLGMPLSGGSGKFETVEYGISLDFRPVVLSPGRISLKVRAAVSEPTNESPGATGDGPQLRSIRKRLADTTVELPSGGTMMVAGLVRDDVRQTMSGMPGISKIPVLGTLFRSRDFVRNETELVVLVTPYLARPMARNEFAKPDDNFNPASDGAGMFLGRVNRVYGTMKTNKPDGRYHGAVGFIYK